MKQCPYRPWSQSCRSARDIPNFCACIYSMYTCACVRERDKGHFTVLQQKLLFLIICKSHHQLNAAVTRASFQSNTAVEFTDANIHSGEINLSSRLLLSSPEGNTCMAGHDWRSSMPKQLKSLGSWQGRWTKSCVCFCNVTTYTVWPEICGHILLVNFRIIHFL